MDEIERNNEMTFGDICRVVRKRIWLTLGVAAGVAVIAVILFAFVLNPFFTYYRMDFELVYPTRASAQYPDGSPFYYHSIVSSEMLGKAQETDPARFSGVDVARMIRDDDVSVSAETREDSGVHTYTGWYTVRIKGSYFANEQTAEDFIRAVAQVTVDDIRSRAAALDYAIEEDVFNSASFEERMELLRTLKETLLAQYDSWIELYQGNYAVKVDGAARTLANYRASVNALYGESMQASLMAQFETNGYNGLDLNAHETVEEAIAARKAQLEEERRLNDEIIQALREILQNTQSSVSALSAASDAQPSSALTYEDISDLLGQFVEGIGTDDQTISEMLAQYVKRNAQIEYQLNTTLTARNVETFADNLNKHYETLTAAAQTLTEVTAAIYSQNSWVTFDLQNAESDGDTSLILVAILGLVLGFLISAIAVCAVDYPKYRASRDAKREEEETPAEEDGD